MDHRRHDALLALDTTSGAALIPEDLEPILVEQLRRLTPLLARTPLGPANGSAHDFNSRTAVNQGTFEGENAETPTGQSTYVRRTVPLKIVRAKGGVSGFQQASAKANIDSLMAEMVGATRGLGWAIEGATLWGDATADPFQYDGLDISIQTNRRDGAGGTVTIDDIDRLLDDIQTQGVFDAPQMGLLMSPQMASKLSQVQGQLRLPRDRVRGEGGFEFETYRDVPIMKSTFTRPNFLTGAPVIADSGTGGGLVPAATYQYKVAVVTLTGEQLASAASTAFTPGGGITSADLTLPVAAVLASGATPLLWKVYRSIDAGAPGSEVLSAIFAGQTFDGDGTPTGTVAVVNDGTADGALGTDKPLVGTLAAPDETIWALWFNSDQSFTHVSLMNQFAQPAPGADALAAEGSSTFLQLLPLARLKDKEDFLVQSYHALAVKAENFNSVLRSIRAS